MWARRRGFAGHLERDKFLFHADHFLLRENRATDKFAFVERHEKSYARFNRRGVLVQFVAVKRIADFRAQRITRARRRQRTWFERQPIGG